MMAPRWKAALILLAVFAAGNVTGAAGMRIAVHGAVVRLVEGPTRVAVKRLVVRGIDDAVGLTDAQRRSISEIVDRTQLQQDRVRAVIAPQLKAGRARQWAEIREALTESQRPAFDRLVERWESRLDAGR